MALAGKCGGRAASGFSSRARRIRGGLGRQRVADERAERRLAKQRGQRQRAKAAAAPQEHVAAVQGRLDESAAVHGVSRRMAVEPVRFNR